MSVLKQKSGQLEFPKRNPNRIQTKQESNSFLLLALLFFFRLFFFFPFFFFPFFVVLFFFFFFQRLARGNARDQDCYETKTGGRSGWRRKEGANRMWWALVRGKAAAVKTQRDQQQSTRKHANSTMQILKESAGQRKFLGQRSNL